jgi:hypothetical protein
MVKLMVTFFFKASVVTNQHRQLALSNREHDKTHTYPRDTTLYIVLGII